MLLISTAVIYLKVRFLFVLKGAFLFLAFSVVT